MQYNINNSLIMFQYQSESYFIDISATFYSAPHFCEITSSQFDLSIYYVFNLDVFSYNERHARSWSYLSDSVHIILTFPLFQFKISNHVS